MGLIMLIVVAPLTSLAVIPLVRERWRPRPKLMLWLSSPWRAAPVIVAANVLALGITFGLLVLLSGVPLAGVVLPGFGGPVLCVALWTVLGMAMPLQGARRWAAAAAGSMPFLLLAGTAWVWFSQYLPNSPEMDNFMAWLGTLIMIAVGVGAAVLGTLVIGLCRPRTGPSL